MMSELTPDSEAYVLVGYEKAYAYYMTESTEVSEAEARQNLMQQLRAKNISDSILLALVRMAQLCACRPVPEVMADASALMGTNATADQNYIGATMLTQSLFWSTTTYKIDAEVLRLSISGFERWLKLRGLTSPWAMGVLYRAYAEKLSEPTDKKLFINKALNLYEYTATHAKCRVDLYNAIYEFLSIEHDNAHIIRFFENVDESLEAPLEYEQLKASEPIPLFTSRPFAKPTNDNHYSMTEVMQGFWLHFEDTRARIEATPYMLMILQRAGAGDGKPCGVTYREAIFERYAIESEQDIRWIDMMYALVRAQYKSFTEMEHYLNAEYAFVKGDEDISRKLLIKFYKNEGDDSLIRVHASSHAKEKGKLARFNQLVDAVKRGI
jgi:hypothetical protein